MFLLSCSLSIFNFYTLELPEPGELETEPDISEIEDREPEVNFQEQAEQDVESSQIGIYLLLLLIDFKFLPGLSVADSPNKSTHK